MNLRFHDSLCVCYFSDACIVTIHTNPFINKMVAPRRVACFRGAHNLEEVLGDFAGNNHDAVEKCAALARDKHYIMFALGNNSVCLSGADTQNRYYTSGTKDADCEDGIVKGDSMLVYSLG